MEHGLLHAHGVTGARGDDHEGLARAVARVVEHELHDADHLGVDALDGAGVLVGHAVSVGDEVERQAAVAEERARPREGLDPAAVEAAVDEFGQVLAARAVAAREGEGGEQLAEARERGVGVALLERRVVVRELRRGAFRLRDDRDREGRRRLGDGIPEHHGLLSAPDAAVGLRARHGAGVHEDTASNGISSVIAGTS